MEGKVSGFQIFALFKFYNHFFYNFFVEIKKKVHIKLSDSIIFEQSQYWENCDSLLLEILLAITMSNFKQIC